MGGQELQEARPRQVLQDFAYRWFVPRQGYRFGEGELGSYWTGTAGHGLQQRARVAEWGRGALRRPGEVQAGARCSMYGRERDESVVRKIDH